MMKHYIKNCDDFESKELDNKIIVLLDEIILSGKYGEYEKNIDEKSKEVSWSRVCEVNDLDIMLCPIICINESFEPDGSIENLYHVELLMSSEYGISLNQFDDDEYLFDIYIGALQEAREIAIKEFDSIMEELIIKLEADSTIELIDSDQLEAERLELKDYTYTIVETMPNYEVDPNEFDWDEGVWPPDEEIVQHFETKEELEEYLSTFDGEEGTDSINAIYNYTEDITEKYIK